ncbi:hypothetical protein HO133_006826 [Letharia lupina]|uniref:Azaphilone pigments biosynthesis cluster protein L N-terminal domain-containing protein n=1 Tax=Letharia lupina TaxID=560253 RepID=A0A8H6F7E6_9LECA|nr:uncharacterized protein HO133_006826 [Letharia lupina]KAF6217488.1 hypothetical protein HO133_006826 [Letharia lupina]
MESITLPHLITCCASDIINGALQRLRSVKYSGGYECARPSEEFKMAEVLAVTGSVITVATLAWQSSKRLHELVDALNNAPEAIAHTKFNLSSMQSTLETLRHTLDTEKSAAFEAALQGTRLADALEGSQQECDRFGKKIQTYTKHSKDTTVSKRDRFTLNFHESEINRFNGRLQDHRQVITLVLTSMNLIISKSSSTDTQQLSERFTTQETELKALNTQLNNTLSHLQSLSLSTRTDENTATAAEDRDWNIHSILRLMSVCRDSISATSEAKPTNLKFGDHSADNSRFFEGVAGRAQRNVTQAHGNAVVTGGSTAARGQMDADTFKIMFGSH